MKLKNTILLYTLLFLGAVLIYYSNGGLDVNCLNGNNECFGASFMTAIYTFIFALPGVNLYSFIYSILLIQEINKERNVNPTFNNNYVLFYLSMIITYLLSTVILNYFANLSLYVLIINYIVTLLLIYLFKHRIFVLEFIVIIMFYVLTYYFTVFDYPFYLALIFPISPIIGQIMFNVSYRKDSIK